MSGDFGAPVDHLGNAINRKDASVSLGKCRQIRRQHLEARRVEAISFCIDAMADRALQLVSLLSRIAFDLLSECGERCDRKDSHGRVKALHVRLLFLRLPPIQPRSYLSKSEQATRRRPAQKCR